MVRYYPIPLGHVEVRIDRRPARSARPHSGHVEGVWGNREVPPVSLWEVGR
jgi:hypothetical protein